jgi:hypothetical protein
VGRFPGPLPVVTREAPRRYVRYRTEVNFFPNKYLLNFAGSPPFAIFEGWDSTSRNCSLSIVRSGGQSPALQLADNFLGGLAQLRLTTSSAMGPLPLLGWGGPR